MLASPLQNVNKKGNLPFSKLPWCAGRDSSSCGYRISLRPLGGAWLLRPLRRKMLPVSAAGGGRILCPQPTVARSSLFRSLRESKYKNKKATYHSVSCLGAPEETRTPDLLIRSQTLYPAELPARNVYYNTIRSPKCQAFFQKKFLLFYIGLQRPNSGRCTCNSGANVINL